MVKLGFEPNCPEPQSLSSEPSVLDEGNALPNISSIFCILSTRSRCSSDSDNATGVLWPIVEFACPEAVVPKCK